MATKATNHAFVWPRLLTTPRWAMGCFHCTCSKLNVGKGRQVIRFIQLALSGVSMLAILRVERAGYVL